MRHRARSSTRAAVRRFSWRNGNSTTSTTDVEVTPTTASTVLRPSAIRRAQLSARRRTYGVPFGARASPHRFTSVMHQVVNQYVGGNPAIDLQYFHGLPGDRALDYEHLIRLDEQLIREKNRADSDQIEALPVKTATSDDKEIRCCICMCDVEVGEKLRVLPCSHKYHQSCIDGKFFYAQVCLCLLHVHTFPFCDAVWFDEFCFLFFRLLTLLLFVFCLICYRMVNV